MTNPELPREISPWILPRGARHHSLRWHLVKKQYYEDLKPARATLLSFLDALPFEVILHILSYLNIPALGRFSRVSRKARSLSNDQALWKVRVCYEKSCLGFIVRCLTSTSSPTSLLPQKIYLVRCPYADGDFEPYLNWKEGVERSERASRSLKAKVYRWVLPLIFFTPLQMIRVRYLDLIPERISPLLPLLPLHPLLPILPPILPSEPPKKVPHKQRTLEAQKVTRTQVMKTQKMRAQPKQGKYAKNHR